MVTTPLIVQVTMLVITVVTMPVTVAVTILKLNWKVSVERWKSARVEAARVDGIRNDGVGCECFQSESG